MKKIFQIAALVSLSLANDSRTKFGKQIDPNANANPLGSHYANAYGKSTSELLHKATTSEIFDASPKQYVDLAIINLDKMERQDSDEVFYKEKSFNRDAILAGVIPADIQPGATQTIPIVDTDLISIDTLVVCSDNTKANVVAIDRGAGTFTIRALTNETLPLIPASANPGSVSFANHSAIERDAATDIKQYLNFSTIERCAYIQLLSKARRLGKVEAIKYNATEAGRMQLAYIKEEIVKHYRNDTANIFWNGKQGEVTLADGTKAKTAGGVFEGMVDNGSYNANAPLNDLQAAFEDLVLSTEYGDYGQTRFLYATPRIILELSKTYKSDKTRYVPNDMIAKLNLEQISIGSSNIVFVPMKRFEESSLFSPGFRNRAILLDHANIKPIYVTPYQTVDTLSRESGANLSTFNDFGVYGSFGIKFHNPLACGWVNIQGL